MKLNRKWFLIIRDSIDELPLIANFLVVIGSAVGLTKPTLDTPLWIAASVMTSATLLIISFISLLIWHFTMKHF